MAADYDGFVLAYSVVYHDCCDCNLPHRSMVIDVCEPVAHGDRWLDGDIIYSICTKAEEYLQDGTTTIFRDISDPAEWDHLEELLLNDLGLTGDDIVARIEEW